MQFLVSVNNRETVFALLNTAWLDFCRDACPATTTKKVVFKVQIVTDEKREKNTP